MKVVSGDTPVAEIAASEEDACAGAHCVNAGESSSGKRMTRRSGECGSGGSGSGGRRSQDSDY